MVTLYDIETGRYTYTREAVADMAQEREPGRFIYVYETESVDPNDISIDGLSLKVGGTC